MNIELFFPRAEEKPLDTLVGDGGLCGVFRTIGCVGDSLSSGEFESLDASGNKTYHDMFEYSWGQYLARMAGLTARNFSRGGMTAKEYCESFAEANGYWNPDLACQGYILALGVNDLFGLKMPLGSLDDVNPKDWRQNQPTFAGYYAQIVTRLQEIQPKARFFFVTMPRDTTQPEREEAKAQHAALLRQFAAYFPHAYVIDLNAHAPVYDEAFHRQFFLGGHMNPAGYLFTARLFASYIDYIIRHNMADFAQIGLIGTPHYREELDQR